MARVRQEKLRLGLKGPEDWKETVVYTLYDNTETRRYHHEVPENGRFYIMLPQVVADALGIKEVRDVDQAAVRVKFLEAIKKFKNLSTETNRVILYKFEVSPLPEGHAAMSKYHSEEQLKVVVWAATYIETVATAGDGARRYSYEKVDSPMNFPGDGYYGPSTSQWIREASRFNTQLPWTAHNEAFFVWIKEAMMELVNRLAELYEPGKLVETIDAGRLLPLGGTKQ